MVQYEAFDRGVEIHGQTILAVVDDALARFSEEYRVAARDALAENAHYYLQNLCEAGLVTAAGTWYSSKGAEMTVYALTCDRIELRLGDGDRSPSRDATPRAEAATQRS